MLRGRTARRPVEIGIDVPGLFVTLRVDRTGVHLNSQPEHRPDTTITAEPEVVLELAAGALTVEQALTVATVEGDPRILDTVFAGASA